MKITVYVADHLDYDARGGMGDVYGTLQEAMDCFQNPDIVWRFDLEHGTWTEVQPLSSVDRQAFIDQQEVEIPDR